MNKLGEKGLYTAESKKKRKQDQINRTREIEELKARVEALTEERERTLEIGKSTKKVDVKVQAARDELEAAENNTKPAIKNDLQESSGTQKTAKRKRSAKAVKEEDDDDAYDAMPAKKSRAKKVKKEEGTEAIKMEEDNDIPAATSAPKNRTARGKKAFKEEDLDGQYNESHDKQKGKSMDETTEFAEGKSNRRSKKGSRNTTKQESSGIDPSPIKEEPTEFIHSLPGTIPAVSAAENYIPGIKDSDLQYDFDTALDAGEINDDFEAYIEMRKVNLKPSKREKTEKGRKTYATLLMSKLFVC
jgi:hypothetical protein